MARTDIHLDAMLRHLGAAYYESLHGRATRADVARALETVEEHLHERAQHHPAGTARTAQQRAAHDRDRLRRPGGWSRKVKDVMTTSVVTVDRITPYKEIVRLLAEHRISGLPVLKMGRQVVGVVTEADLLAAEVQTARRLHASGRVTWWPRRARQPALTAGQLMTTPAITIAPDATLPAAARLIDTHHIRRLPVTGDDGKLRGIISRRDLLSVFLRPDADIAADACRVLDEFLLADVDATVSNGIITLTGTLGFAAAEYAGLIPLAIRLMWDVEGVVDIVDRLAEPQPCIPAPATSPEQVTHEQPGE
jgi:CBS domain-containing protein